MSQSPRTTAKVKELANRRQPGDSATETSPRISSNQVDYVKVTEDNEDGTYKAELRRYDTEASRWLNLGDVLVVTPRGPLSIDKEYQAVRYGENLYAATSDDSGMRDINSWRHISAGSGIERTYFAGVNTNTNISETVPAIIQGGRMYALPIFCPPGGTIDKLLIEVTTAAEWPEARLRLGIYEALSQSNIYPGELVFGSDEIDSSTTGVKTVDCEIDLQQGTLYWMVLLHKESASQVGLVVSRVQEGNGVDEAEIQSFYVENADSGTYFLEFDGLFTNALSYTANAATVEAALELSTNVGDVTVTGSGTSADPFLITFEDDFDPKVMLTWTSGSLSGGVEVARYASQNAIDFYPIWGCPIDALHISAALGHHVAQTYGEMPETFPTDDPVFLIGSSQEQIPKLGVHFESIQTGEPPPTGIWTDPLSTAVGGTGMNSAPLNTVLAGDGSNWFAASEIDGGTF